MNIKIAKTALLSLTALILLLSCNLDGEGVFYGIATAKEITTGSGYAQINKVLRYDGTTAYVQAGNRISYKTASQENFTDVDLPDEITSISDIVFDSANNYFILSLDKLYKVPADASSADQVLSGPDIEILMLLETNDTAYAIYDDGDLKLEDLTNSITYDLNDSILLGDFISLGTFITYDSINTTYHLFLSTDEDKVYHSDSTDFLSFTDISSSGIKPVGGIALGADIYVYGYTQTSDSIGVYELNGASTFDAPIASLSTDDPKRSEAALPTVVVDDGTTDANNKTILIYVRYENLLEFKPTDETLAFASGYGLSDEKVLSFYRITDNEFFTATNDSGLLYTLNKNTDGF
jgi:hypothetical protein